MNDVFMCCHYAAPVCLEQSNLFFAINNWIELEWLLDPIFMHRVDLCKSYNTVVT